MVAESERCAGCGLTDEQTWHVFADPKRCPACEDRDRHVKNIGQSDDTMGWHVGFTTLTDVEERETLSSAARYTLEGSRLRRRRKREQRGD